MASSILRVAKPVLDHCRLPINYDKDCSWTHSAGHKIFAINDISIQFPLFARKVGVNFH